jgi:DNA-binding PadR family transcriptional regulator
VARSDSLEMGELTDTAFYIMLTLVNAKHGYSIMKSIEEMTNNTFSVGPASMYTTIRKLLEANFIELLEEQGDKKKTYIMTAEGLQLLKKEVNRRKTMVQLAEQIFEEKEL